MSTKITALHAAQVIANGGQVGELHEINSAGDVRMLMRKTTGEVYWTKVSSPAAMKMAIAFAHYVDMFEVYPIQDEMDWLSYYRDTLHNEDKKKYHSFLRKYKLDSMDFTVIRDDDKHESPRKNGRKTPPYPPSKFVGKVRSTSHGTFLSKRTHGKTGEDSHKCVLISKRTRGKIEKVSYKWIRYNPRSLPSLEEFAYNMSIQHLF